VTIRVRELILPLDAPESLLPLKAAERLGVPAEAVTQWQTSRRSLDARGRSVRFVYTLDLTLADPSQEADAIRQGVAVPADAPQLEPPMPGREEIRGRVVVTGCGPAGLFAALALSRQGYRPLLLERGADVDRRRQDVESFHSHRELNVDSNLLFGAGGAGTYSDGKLRTRIRDPRIKEILKLLVAAGAPESILVDARPHIGTDLLRSVVRNLCRALMAQGGEISWNTKLTGLIMADGRLRAVVASGETIETNCLVLAMGANARDTFEQLRDSGLAMEAKPFQMGLRIEHPRGLIDRGIYGPLAGHPRLGAAEYVLSACSVTSFCVCPGGIVVAASVEPGTVCTNGMSNRARDGDFTNAGLVATVRPDEFGTAPHSGLAFQRRWEQKGFEAGGGSYAAPAQNVPDFLSGVVRPLVRGSTYPFGVEPAQLQEILPRSVVCAIASALLRFDRRIPGFAGEAGILIGPETRASCPVRVLRDPDTRVSVSVDGIYPAGEGSGYASGIMSSAVDGLRAAEAAISRFTVPRH